MLWPSTVSLHCRTGLSLRTLIILQMGFSSPQSCVSDNYTQRLNSSGPEHLPNCIITQQFFRRVSGKTVCSDCTKCRPGWGVELECMGFNDTKCKPCEDGVTYSLEYPHVRVCDGCKVCDGQVVLRRCTRYNDVLCGKCKPGFKMNQATLECESDPLFSGQFWHGSTVTTLTTSSAFSNLTNEFRKPSASITASGTNSGNLALVVVTVIPCLFLVTVVMFFMLYVIKRRQAAKSEEQDAEREILQNLLAEIEPTPEMVALHEPIQTACISEPQATVTVHLREADNDESQISEIMPFGHEGEASVATTKDNIWIGTCDEEDKMAPCFSPCVTSQADPQTTNNEDDSDHASRVALVVQTL